MRQDAALAYPDSLPAARRSALEHLEAVSSAWRLALRACLSKAALSHSAGPGSLASLGDVAYRDFVRLTDRVRGNLSALCGIILPKDVTGLDFAVIVPNGTEEPLPAWTSTATGHWGFLDLSDSARVGRWLLDESSRHFLLHARYGRFSVTRARLSYFSSFVASNGYRHDQVLLDASSVLELYGLRRAQRLDYLAVGPERVNRSCIHRNDEELIHHGTTCEALLENPACHFRLGELRCVSFAQLERFKRSRRGDEDVYDLGMMRALETNNSTALLWYRGGYELSLALHEFRGEWRRLTRRLFGNRLGEPDDRRHNRRSH